MSGLYGVIYAAHDRPVEHADLMEPLQRLAHRGPHGLFLWHEQNAGLANALFAFDGATAGIVHSADGGLSITADARIDNRGDLIERLGLQGAGTLDDAAILLAAFRRWDVGCAEHLLGDFAFAVWDKNRKRLVCIRDHFGVKPLYYRRDAHGLRFGSEIKALLGKDETPAINEARIADFLAGISQDPSSTAYSDIFRVPAAHTLTYEKGDLSVRRYWSVEADTPCKPSDIPDMLHERLDSAVQSRLRSTLPIGAMLSGGLDSSTIVGLAAPRLQAAGSGPLRTFSFVYKATPSLDERRYIDQVLAQHACSPRFIVADRMSPLAEFDHLLAEQDDIFFAPRLGIARKLYQEASAEGIRIMLDGHGGDEVISYGSGRLQELATEGRWLKATTAILHESMRQGSNPVSQFLDYYQSFGRGGRFLGAPRARLRRVLGTPSVGAATARKPLGLTDEGFAARHRLTERLRESQRLPAGAQSMTAKHHLMTLRNNIQVDSFEVLDRVCAASGIEGRYPFWDRRVVTFCLSVPSAEVFKNGLTRMTLRRAMRRVLPPAIAKRPDKTNFSSELATALAEGDAELSGSVFLRKRTDLAQFVDMSSAAEIYRRLKDGAHRISPTELMWLWKIVFLSEWLRLQNKSKIRGSHEPA